MGVTNSIQSIKSASVPIFMWITILFTTLGCNESGKQCAKEASTLGNEPQPTGASGQVGVDNSINEKNSQGRTPLYHAVARHDAEEVERLLQKGADPNLGNKKQRGWTPLHLVASSVRHRDSMLKIVRFLLESRKTDIEAKDDCGNTPLHVAVSFGNLPIVRELLYRGAEVNAGNASSRTP